MTTPPKTAELVSTRTADEHRSRKVFHPAWQEQKPELPESVLPPRSQAATRTSLLADKDGQHSPGLIETAAVASRRSRALGFGAGAMVLLVLLGGCDFAPRSAAPQAASAVESAAAVPRRDHLFQFALVDALLAGAIQGDYTIGQVRQQGDFGLGTFNHLDGEMLVLDGRVYQLKADGRAYLASDTLQTPFAAVHFFRADRRLPLHRPLSQAALQHYLDSLLDVKNSLYALKITGTFARVRARSVVPIYRHPPPPIAGLLNQQRVFTFDTVRGTLVGYRLPAFLKGTHIPGYHFHLLTADRQRGGHVLAYTLLNGVLDVDSLHSYSVQLAKHPDSYHTQRNQDRKLR